MTPGARAYVLMRTRWALSQHLSHRPRYLTRLYGGPGWTTDPRLAILFTLEAAKQLTDVWRDTKPVRLRNAMKGWKI